MSNLYSPCFVVLQDELENVQAQLGFQEERLRETSDVLVKTNEELKLERQNVIVRCPVFRFVSFPHTFQPSAAVSWDRLMKSCTSRSLLTSTTPYIAHPSTLRKLPHPGPWPDTT